MICCKRLRSISRSVGLAAYLPQKLAVHLALGHAQRFARRQVEYERFTWSLIPENLEDRQAVESRVASYRPEPEAIMIRVGEGYSISKPRAIALDQHGRDLRWLGHRIDGIEDPAIVELDARGNLVGLSPGATRLVLTPCYRTAKGGIGTVYVNIIVRPA